MKSTKTSLKTFTKINQLFVTFKLVLRERDYNLIIRLLILFVILLK